MFFLCIKVIGFFDRLRASRNGASSDKRQTTWLAKLRGYPWSEHSIL